MWQKAWSMLIVLLCWIQKKQTFCLRERGLLLCWPIFFIISLERNKKFLIFMISYLHFVGWTLGNHNASTNNLFHIYHAVTFVELAFSPSGFLFLSFSLLLFSLIAKENIYIKKKIKVTRSAFLGHRTYREG